ncbi:MAG: hypothetical protein SangKO_055690 [Sandaracinaceae bacterium]
MQCKLTNRGGTMRKTALVLAALVALNASFAAAQEDTDPVARARVVFGDALEAYEAHEYANAARLFRQVYDLMDGQERQYVVLYNLGQCLKDAGQYEEARTAFLRYLDEGGELVQNRGEVDGLLEEIAERLGENDEPVVRETVLVERGPDEGLVTTSLISFGVGAAGFVAMGVFGGLALAEHDALQSGCGATRSCTADEVATADTFALVADIGLGVGAAGVAAGLALLLIGISSGGGSEQATAFSPWVTADGAGATGWVRW